MYEQTFVFFALLCEQVATLCVVLLNICALVGDDLEEAHLEEDHKPPGKYEGWES